MIRTAKRVTWTFLMALLVLATYCYWRFQDEQRWLAVKARQITDQAGAQTQRERIMALRDYLRVHVKWRGAAYDNRPFLRATARETLESGLGYCGESTRAFINLAHQLGIKAHRVNLYGPSPHVIAEAEVRPGVDILVDVQDSPVMNAYFDRRDWTLDEAIRDPDVPFESYSNIHLRRVPILSQYLSRVKMRNSAVTWTLENPWLIGTYAFGSLFVLIAGMLLVDRIAIRFYAYRLGVRMPRPRVHPLSRSRMAELLRRVADRLRPAAVNDGIAGIRSHR